ncbi:MAG: phosphoenolpyruvate--protein phosphotransferase [Balneolaceae bacterium]
MTVESTYREITLEGAPASPGLAEGEAYFFQKHQPVIRPNTIAESQVQNQLERFERACELVVAELERLKRKAQDSESSDIISAQIQIVEDPELRQKIKKLIEEEHQSVDYAVYSVFESYLEMIENSENNILKERSVDITDIRDRIIQIITNNTLDVDIEPGSIVVAKELSPSDLIELSGHDIQALVMDSGGPSSHASIIARALGLPAVVGTRRVAKLLRSCAPLIVDGNRGIVILNPAEETRTRYKREFEQYQQQEEELRKVLDLPSETSDGHPFTLRANVELGEEMPMVTKYKAAGIGLLRTESVYVQKEHFENHERQFRFYKSILSDAEDLPVTIRLFDAGGDKLMGMGTKERNPFLGWRGVRMLLDERDLLRQQLKAILKVAGIYPGRVRLLVPMITNVDEMLEVKEEVRRVQKELEQEGKKTDPDILFGIMVEVPAVAIQAKHFAPHVDFFSIGSNDLTQYALAVDRGNEYISSLYRQEHPAVWHLIHQTVQASDIPVSICGELASYPEAAACLLGMGISELSMSPVSIPRVKQELVSHSIADCRKLAERVLSAESAAEVDRIFKKWSHYS